MAKENFKLALSGAIFLQIGIYRTERTLAQKKKKSTDDTISNVYVRKKMSSGGAIVRKVSMEPARKRKRAKVSSVPKSLRNYISTRGTPNGVHEFTRNVWGQFLCSAGGIAIPSGGAIQAEFAMRFDVGGVVFIAGGTSTQTLGLGYTELSALFDQIKLDKVEIKFMARNDSTQNAVGVNSEAIRIATAIDYNDDTPISETALREYGSFKDAVIEPGGREHRVVLRPKFQQQVTFSGGAGTIGFNASSGYVNSSTLGTGVAHYGIKGNVVGSSAGTNLLISVKYYYKCKNTR